MKIILTSPPEIIRKNSGQELWHTSFQLYISPQDTTENGTSTDHQFRS